MAVYVEPPAVVTGQLMTATNWNTWVRTNMQALWPFTTAGDLAYASAADQLSRLAIGNAYQGLGISGGVPAWAALANLIGRKGGSSTDWYSQGTTDYTPSNAVIQVGTARIAVSGSPGSGSVSITFPVAFAYKPVVFFDKPYDGAQVNDLGFSSISTTGFSIYVAYAGAATINLDVTWIAIGPK